jgi:iron complex transport system substrate-binding protein
MMDLRTNGMKGCLFAFLIWLFLAGPVQAELPQRIISLAPAVTEILYDLGLGNQIIAVSTYCNYPPAARLKPKIGGMSNPSLEAILAMKPDLVVLTDDGNPREIEARLRKLGIRTHIFRAKRLDELSHAIRTLGAALHVPKVADQRAARIKQVIDQYRQKTGARERTPLKVLCVVQPDPLMVVGPGTTIDDVFKLLGLRNVAAGMKSEYPRYSLEEVFRQSPDIIFIAQGHGNMAVASRRLLNKLNQLEAVRRGRVYYTGDSLMRLGPRIPEGIAEIAGYADVKNQH